MKDVLRVGIVIADEDEYAPLRSNATELCAERCDFYKREGHKFSFEKNSKKVVVHTILSGIGMVNAAAAATYLASEGSDIILNSGLSGGISGIKRGELMVGTEYIEHDFDLTPLGYPLCKKPLQNYIYKADDRLLEIIEKLYPEIKKGVAVSGDSFISDASKKEFLKKEFSAMSCDMESAAVAYVCELADIGFASIRRISDDAGDDAAESYSNMNSLREEMLIELLIKLTKSFLDFGIFWE